MSPRLILEQKEAVAAMQRPFAMCARWLAPAGLSDSTNTKEWKNYPEKQKTPHTGPQRVAVRGVLSYLRRRVRVPFKARSKSSSRSSAAMCT